MRYMNLLQSIARVAARIKPYRLLSAIGDSRGGTACGIHQVKANSDREGPQR